MLNEKVVPAPDNWQKEKLNIVLLLAFKGLYFHK